MKHKLPGLRTAAIVYVLLVITALGGAGAHALWSQSGTVVAPVTAGTWGPEPGKVGTVTCARGTNVDSSTNVTVSWQAVEATAYQLTVVGVDGGSADPKVVTQPTSGGTVSTTINFRWPGNNSGQGKYTLSITAKTADKTGTATTINVDLIHKSSNTVSCTP